VESGGLTNRNSGSEVRRGRSDFVERMVINKCGGKCDEETIVLAAGISAAFVQLGRAVFVNSSIKFIRTQ
jgi:hypothetical protein